MEEEGYELTLSIKNSASVYCVQDYNMCMLVVSDGQDEGCIWLNLFQLDQVIENLNKVKDELENE